jgi:hypothetical protein
VQQLRAVVLPLHNNRCQRCGTTGVPLQLHHLDRDVTNNAISNVLPVCRSCHAKINRD